MEVTLTIPENIYEQAKKLAKERQKNVADILTEFTLVGEAVTRNVVTQGQEADESNILAQEEATFIALHPMLKEKFAGEYVAIHGRDLVDHDTDLTALSQRIFAQFGNTPVWVAPVLENPVEEWIFRSPYIVQ